MGASDETASPVVTGSSVAGGTFQYGDGIVVDFSALRDFAQTLRVMSSELGQRGAMLTVDVFDPDLVEALSHAERDWSSQRRRLASFLDGAAKSVESGLAGYRELETDLVRAAATSRAR